MPELPFLTVLAENLAAQVHGRTIEDVLVRGVSALKTVDPPIASLRGARIARMGRRGKYLLFDLETPASPDAPAGGGDRGTSPAPAGADRIPDAAEAPGVVGMSGLARPPADPAGRPGLVLVIHLRRHGRLQVGRGEAATLTSTRALWMIGPGRLPAGVRTARPWWRRGPARRVAVAGTDAAPEAFVSPGTAPSGAPVPAEYAGVASAFDAAVSEAGPIAQQPGQHGYIIRKG